MSPHQSGPGPHSRPRRQEYRVDVRSSFAVNEPAEVPSERTGDARGTGAARDSDAKDTASGSQAGAEFDPAPFAQVGLYDHLVLARSMNHRQIELHMATKGEQVGLLKKDGGARFVPWLGFIDRTQAQRISAAIPVKMVIKRIGVRGELAIAWRDLGEHEYVQGCLVATGVYAVVEGKVRVV